MSDTPNNNSENQDNKPADENTAPEENKSTNNTAEDNSIKSKPDQTSSAVTKKPFPIKLTIKLTAIAIALIALFIFRTQVIWFLSLAAMVTSLGFLAYAIFAGVMIFIIKKPKEKYDSHLQRGCAGAFIAILCYMLIGWLGGIILPASFDDETIEKIQTSLYLMGLDEAVVTETPDNSLVIAYGLQSADAAVEAIAKSGSIMGAAATVCPKGTVYTIGIVQGRPVIGIRGNLSDVASALDNPDLALQLQSKLKVIDADNLSKLWK